MEIIDILKKVDSYYSTHLFRILYPIKTGKYKLSIQGSEQHYSIPKITTNIDNYISFELGIFKKNGNKLINIKQSKIFKNFSRYDELLKYRIGKNNCVYGYVPIDLLNDLYLYLKGI